jgi:SAM-dependent methyltransferase
VQAGLAVGAAGALLGRSRRGRVLIVGAALLLVPTAVARGFRRAAYFPPAQVVVAEEDAHGLFQIVRAGGDELRVLADTTDLVFRFGNPQTAIAQSMQAHLGMLYAPQARAVLNIGTGYGITAGAFTLHRGLERIDTVEILPLLIAHRRRFASGNLGYDRDPRVHIHVADGRHFLATAPTRYDIISVNITDPYLPGNSSLHSAEFYQLVRDHLTPDGVLVQQVFGPDRATLVHQIRRYFPHLAAAPSYAPDLNVVASRRALALDDARLAAFFDGHSVPLGRLGFASATGLAAHLAAGAAALGRLLATPAHFVETDDRPVLEFRVVPGQVHWLHTAQ